MTAQKTAAIQSEEMLKDASAQATAIKAEGREGYCPGKEKLSMISEARLAIWR